MVSTTFRELHVKSTKYQTSVLFIALRKSRMIAPRFLEPENMMITLNLCFLFYLEEEDGSPNTFWECR